MWNGAAVSLKKKLKKRKEKARILIELIGFTQSMAFLIDSISKKVRSDWVRYQLDPGRSAIGSDCVFRFLIKVRSFSSTIADDVVTVLKSISRSCRAIDPSWR